MKPSIVNPFLGTSDAHVVPLDANETITDAGGIDGIDLSGGAFAADIDLDRPAPQVTDTAGHSLALAGAFENVRGTSFNDRIKGTAGRNILEGFGGRDEIDGRGEADTLQGGFPQLVYLDFDSATGRNVRST